MQERKKSASEEMLREIPTQVATKIAINNKAQQWRNDRKIMFKNGNKTPRSNYR